MDMLRKYTSNESDSNEDEMSCHTASEEKLLKGTDQNCSSSNQMLSSCNKKFSLNTVSNQRDFFALNDDDTTDEEDTVTNSDNGDSANIKEDNLNEFWNPTKAEVVRWDEPSKIWKCQTNGADMKISSPKSNRRKRGPHEAKSHSIDVKKLKYQDHPMGRTPIAKPLSRPAFFVHHKVAPFLHQTIANKTPRSLLLREKVHFGCVNSVVWCSQAEHSHLLLSSSHDKTIKLWNAFGKDGITCLQTIAEHDKGVRSVKWVKGTKHILSASFDKTARIFDLERGNITQLCNSFSKKMNNMQSRTSFERPPLSIMLKNASVGVSCPPLFVFLDSVSFVGHCRGKLTVSREAVNQGGLNFAGNQGHRTQC